MQNKKVLSTIYSIDKIESDRIDILKIAGTFLVLLNHAYVFESGYITQSIQISEDNWAQLLISFISHTIAMVGLPIFLLLSAILLFRKSRNYSTLIKMKIKTLLIPYLLWNTLTIIFFLVVASVPSLSRYINFPLFDIKNYNLSNWLTAYGIYYQGPILFPLWTIRDIFVMNIFSPIIYGLVKLAPNTIMLAALLLYLYPIQLPYGRALFWFIVGAFMVIKQIKIQDIDKVTIVILAIPYILFGILKVVCYHPLFDSISLFFGVFTWIKLSRILVRSNMVKKIKDVFLDHYFIIYAIHSVLLIFLIKLAKIILPQTNVNYLVIYISVIVVTIIISLIISFVLKKSFPKLHHLLTGSR